MCVGVVTSWVNPWAAISLTKKIVWAFVNVYIIISCAHCTAIWVYEGKHVPGEALNVSTITESVDVEEVKVKGISERGLDDTGLVAQDLVHFVRLEF